MTTEELLDRRRLAAIGAATSGEDGGCGCSACEILRGEHDEILDEWIED